MKETRDRRIVSIVRAFKEEDPYTAEDIADNEYDEASMSGCDDLSYSAVTLANALYARGQRNVLLGNSSGWRDIERASHLSIVAVRLMGVHVPSSAREVAFGIAHIAHHAAPELIGLGLDALADAKPDVCRDLVTPPIAFWLGAKLAIRETATDLPAPFDGLLATEDEQLEQALVRCAEYRLQNSYLDEGGTDEFMNVPLLPSEIHAVLRSTGRELRSAHALFQQPLAQPAPKTDYSPAQDGMLCALLSWGVTEGLLDVTWRTWKG